VNTTGGRKLELNQSAFAVHTAGAERLKIDSSGNVGVATSTPTSTLHVIGGANITGLCVAEDSLITLADGSKKKIKDIKEGDVVRSLDEQTGKIIPNKVNALLDHGVKPIYEFATEDGRAINTTAEHPYFVKSSLPGIGDDLKLPSSFNSIKNPSKSSGLDLFLSLLVHILHQILLT